MSEEKEKSPVVEQIERERVTLSVPAKGSWVKWAFLGCTLAALVAAHFLGR